MDDVGTQGPPRTGEGSGDQVGWRYLELVYDATDRTRVRLDGVVLPDDRELGDVLAELGRDGWEMVGSAAAVGTNHVLWFRQAAGQTAAVELTATPVPAGAPAPGALHDVTLVSAGNSWFDPAARARLIAALQELTGQSGWRVGRMVDKAPRVVAEGVTRDEADRIRQVLEDLGATVKVG